MIETATAGIDWTRPLLFAAPGTAAAVREGRKDVTRRVRQPDRWLPGQALFSGPPWRVRAWSRCYERSPRVGGRPFGRIQIARIDSQVLADIAEMPEDVARECVAGVSTVEDFMFRFCAINRVPENRGPARYIPVWRIEFGGFSALTR